MTTNAAVSEFTAPSEREPTAHGEAPTVDEHAHDQAAEVVAGRVLRVVQPLDLADAIRRGYSPGHATIVIDLSGLLPESRELLAVRVRAASDGEDLTVADRFGHDLKVCEPTLASLLEALNEDEAARVKQERERQAGSGENLKRLREATDEEILEYWSDYNDGPTLFHWGFRSDDDKREACQALGDRLDALRQRRREQLASQKAEAERRRAAAEVQNRAKADRERAEREVWIEAHGSDRLRRLVAEEIEYRAVYSRERLALERPGWAWAVMPGAAAEPRNAPTVALDLLDQARASVPEDQREDVRLVRWTVEFASGDDYGDDSYDEPETVHGYTCEARFLGRVIVYRVAHDGTPPVRME